MTHKQTSKRTVIDRRPRDRNWLLQLLRVLVPLLLLLAIIALLVWIFLSWAAPPTILTPQPDAVLTDSHLVVAGAGGRGAQVEVLIDGHSRGMTAVNPEGGWFLTTDVNEPGEHWIHGRIVNRLGIVVAASNPIRFFRTAAPLPPTPPLSSTRTLSGAVIISNTVAPHIVVKVEAPPKPTRSPTATPCASDPPFCPVEPLPTTSPSCPEQPTPCQPTPSPTPWPCPDKPRPCQPTPYPPPTPFTCGKHSSPPTCPRRGGRLGGYRVAPGDTFSSIARRFGYSVRELRAANPQIRNPNMIYVGQVIHLPAR